MSERWAVVAGWPAYEVSDRGRVRSHHTGGRGGPPPREVTVTRGVAGYGSFGVYGNGKRRALKLARVMLEAFTGPCPPGHEAAHLDGNPANDAIENLQWTTHAANLAHKRAHGTMTCGERHPNAKLTAEVVRQIRSAAAAGSTTAEVAKAHGITAPHARDIIRRKLWAHVD